MELFTKGTTGKDLLKYFNWDLRMFDLVQPINKVGGKIELFENEMLNYQQSKQWEFIILTLRDYKDIIKDFYEVFEKSDITTKGFDSHFALSLEYGHVLGSKICKLYTDGQNPCLSVFQNEILDILNLELLNNQDAISQKIEFNEDLPDLSIAAKNLISASVKLIEDKFDNVTIEYVKDYYFKYIGEIFEHVINSIDFLKYLENRINDFDEPKELMPSVKIEAIKPTIVNIPIKKIKWEGKLNEFAELIDQLRKLHYINTPDGELKPIVETLCACFDFSGTQKSEKSDTVKSLYQYLKPSEVEYKIYTKRYIPKFESILPEK